MPSTFERSLRRNSPRRRFSCRPRLQQMEQRVCRSDVFPQYHLVEPSAAVGGNFGITTLMLSTGNIVVTSTPSLSGGVTACYLYNGQTGALISTLTGGGNVGGGYTVTALTNGNYVLSGDDTATWGSGTAGVSGIVSAANSLVAGGAPGGVTVVPLANGNYVANFLAWNGNTGAVAWGNGTTGATGTVSAANSLVGSNFGDDVGGGYSSAGDVVALPDGNYVVYSPDWNHDEGAVTWGNGATGITGTISAANSLIVGGDTDASLRVTALTNSNYVVSNYQWNGLMGAVTWGSGATGISGVVSAANSLVGTNTDNLGRGGITPLTNGNYVVASPEWNGSEGAATWENGTTGTTGTVSSANSVVGSNVNDGVGGETASIADGGVTALANGNYVVDSPDWDDDDGAVTWGNGTSGTAGTVSVANSLVGTNEDSVGEGGITVLANGNYVVASPLWNYEEGAVTWGNGTAGITGTISATNSLIGSTPDTVANGDEVGGFGLIGGSQVIGDVTALTNSNYVVDSPGWNSEEGAVTWGNGMTGSVGIVASANSLVGSYALDRVGSNGVTALTNGNYVVDSSNWNDLAGAVTWGNGTTGITGPISIANSLIGGTSNVGSQPGDIVGANAFVGPDADGVVALTDGNFFVISYEIGMATWGNGSTGTTGIVSAINSLDGLAHDDPYTGVAALPNGNCVVFNPSFDTWVNGATGSTFDGQNTPEAANTIFVGTANAFTIQAISSGSSFLIHTTIGFPGLGLVSPTPTPTLAVALISPITPSPRNYPVTTLSLNLNEAAGSDGFGINALTLTDNGGPNLITSAVSITLVSGSTYQISGLSGLTAAEGLYTLTVNASDIVNPGGIAGSGSVSTSWLMDTTPPTSTIVALPAETASTSFTVSATSTDPEGASGSSASGVSSIAIYDSTNGGPFVLFATVSPSSPSVTFNGQTGNAYSFYSIATDNAGNVESVPAAAEATVRVINTPTSTPTASVVTGQQSLFQRKTNKNGKPTGKPVLSGFTIDFAVPLDAAAADNAANYQVDTVSTKKVKKKVETIFHPITKFTVSYLADSDAVEIKFGSNEKFPTGGQITILGGMTTTQGGTLSGSTIFTISKGGKMIERS